MSKKSSSKGLIALFVILILLCAAAMVALYFYQNGAPSISESGAPQTTAPSTSEQGSPFATDPSTGEQGSPSADSSSPHGSSGATGENGAPQTAVPTTSENGSSSPSPQIAGEIFLPQGLEYPACPADHQAPDHQIRSFKDYKICYRESYESAEWSAYLLEKSELVKNAGRSDDFRSDPEITTGSATLADYRSSGYDRGHLAPAADFSYSQEAMSETFYMSNMTAQAPQFNRGIWKSLEEQVRLWAEEYGRVYVVTGPILEKDASEYASIGTNQVSIPQYFYKVILAPVYRDEEDAATPQTCENLQAFAYIIPNRKCEEPFSAYSTSIDTVEERTGIDFFYLLDDQIENAVESQR